MIESIPFDPGRFQSAARHYFARATYPQRLIEKVELETVTSFFAMEAIEEQRPIPLRPLNG